MDPMGSFVTSWSGCPWAGVTTEDVEGNHRRCVCERHGRRLIRDPPKQYGSPAAPRPGLPRSSPSRAPPCPRSRADPWPPRHGITRCSPSRPHPCPPVPGCPVASRTGLPHGPPARPRRGPPCRTAPWPPVPGSVPPPWPRGPRRIPGIAAYPSLPTRPRFAGSAAPDAPLGFAHPGTMPTLAPEHAPPCPRPHATTPTTCIVVASMWRPSRKLSPPHTHLRNARGLLYYCYNYFHNKLWSLLRNQLSL